MRQFMGKISQEGFPLIIVIAISTFAALICAPATVGQSNGTTEQIDMSGNGAPANFGSEVGISLSADGRFLAFSSWASNLAPDQQAFNFQDIFVRDRVSGATELVSVNSSGVQSDGISIDPIISADGRFVAYTSSATTLVAGDTNSRRDIFVHDRLTRVTERVSVSSAGAQANGDSSPGFFPSGVAISADGRRVAFSSSATNLAPGDTNTCAVRFYYSFPSSGQCPDIFVRDREAGTTTRASLTFSGVEANNASYRAVMSSDGNVLAYLSLATNLVPGDTSTPSCITFPFRANACQHIFARLTP